MIGRMLVTAGLALGLGFSAARAQTAAPASPAPTAAPAPASKKPRTAQSLACSTKADQQGLHGKPRKHFMKSCKAGKG